MVSATPLIRYEQISQYVLWFLPVMVEASVQALICSKLRSLSPNRQLPLQWHLQHHSLQQQTHQLPPSGAGAAAAAAYPLALFGPRLKASSVAASSMAPIFSAAYRMP